MDTLLTITTNRQESSTTSVALDPDYTLAIQPADSSEFTILIGDLDEISIDLVTELAAEVVGPDRTFNSIATRTGDRLFELAQSTRPVIIFLLLNNVFIHKHNFPVTDRIEAVIRVIAEIRTKLGIPVIVYSGLEGYEPAVRAAGVEYYLRVPFGLEEFRAAIRATIDKYQL